jgi:murein DD-endopeptidase MepM/ murein hydrolase activator NlpD
LKALIVVLALMVAAPAAAQVKFRVPLSMLSDQCAGGRCYPTAYFDTNRSLGYRRDYACGARTYNQHDGIDLGIGGFPAMTQGRWVMSAASGTVIAAHDGEFDRCTTGNCGTANYVKIRHADGKVTVYWHLKRWSVRVRVGQFVPCGVFIGQVGSSGYSTGPHLHFGVLVNGVADDPFGASSTSCGGTFSWWTKQGAYGGLPGNVCQ